MFYISLIAAKVFLLLQKIFIKEKNDKAGLGALKLYPNFLKKVSKPPVIIAITGTNGKTTTSNLLVDVLEDQGYKVACNRGGSNYQAGVVTAILKGVSLFNKTKVDYLVVEYDEISSDKILSALKPNYLIVSNITRDSMNRNAHTDFVFKQINQGIEKNTTLILNADDPISSRLGKDNKKVFFAIDKLPEDLDFNHSLVNDMPNCPKCYRRLKYDFVRYHHMGKFYCPKGDFKAPKAEYLITKVEKDKIIVKHQEKLQKYPIIQNSIFNIYNSLAVIATLKELGFKAEVIAKSFKQLKITEIRLKTTKVGNTEVIAHMTKGKNAVATSRVFDYVSNINANKEIVLMIEDYYDRVDTSEAIAWLYDADFEFLKKDDIKRIVVCGVRHQDIILRLLIAGIPQEKIFGTLKEEDAINHLALKNTDQVYILYEIPFINYANPLADKIAQKLKGETK